MPKPNENETRDDFIKRCIPIVIKDGTAKDQANTVCSTLWKEGGNIGERGGDRGGSKDRPLNLKLETKNMEGVEVLEAGTFKGITTTEADIDEMINNFDNQVTEPYLTIDHSHFATSQFKDALQALSLGFVESMKRNGNKLVANFKQVPKQVAELIEAGALKKKSIEFYKKYVHADGSIYKNVLQGVTFHGANGSPAVTTLSDFVNLYKNDLTEKTQDNENKVITFGSNEPKKENQMAKIEIEKQEYDSLLKMKNDSDIANSELETLKTENADLTKSVDDIKAEKIELEKSKTEFEKYKKDVEDDKVVELKKEAEDYINKQIENKKVTPASKYLYIEQYVTYKSDDEKFETFKKDIEGREVEMFKNVKGDDGNADSKSVDDIDDMIQVEMKNGKSFDEARVIAFKKLEA